jgi:hypothetical protein
MNCLRCGLVSKKIRSRQTCMASPTFIDENGKEHVHNRNQVYTEYKCDRCDYIFSCPNYNSCWCGWTNQFLEQT